MNPDEPVSSDTYEISVRAVRTTPHGRAHSTAWQGALHRTTPDLNTQHKIAFYACAGGIITALPWKQLAWKQRRLLLVGRIHRSLENANT